MGRNQSPDVRVRVNGLLLFAAISFLLSTEIAYPLYEVLPFLQRLQWPYRFVMPATLMSSLALAFSLASVTTKLSCSRFKLATGWACVSV